MDDKKQNSMQAAQPTTAEARAASNQDYIQRSTISNIVHWQPGISLESMERQVILAAFRYYRGNKTATAQSLGIAIRTLDNKLEKYEADDKSAKERNDAHFNEREEFLKAQRGEKSNWKPQPIDPGISKSLENARARKTEGAHGASANGGLPEGRLRMEPAQETTSEQSVPVSVGSEVQKVSSKPTSGHSNNKRR